jgi:hypothetical protein
LSFGTLRLITFSLGSSKAMIFGSSLKAFSMPNKLPLFQDSAMECSLVTNGPTKKEEGN